MMQTHWEAIIQVRKDREAARQRLGEIVDMLPQLKSDSEQLEHDLKTMNSRLDTVTEVLKEKAIPPVVWARVVDIVCCVMTVIPYAQPALGMAGKAVKSASHYIAEGRKTQE